MRTILKTLLLGVVFLLLVPPVCGQLPEETNLLTIRGQGIVAGILPDAGGRLVLLRTEKGKNWLDSNPAAWGALHPQPALESPFSYSLFGAVVWAGPQSAFWTDQDLDPGRKARKAIWPPDPFNEWGRASVQKKSETEVLLRVPASPVTGLQMTKIYRISKTGELTLEIIATNTRPRLVRWDLWPDIHVDPHATVYVPLAPDRPLRVEFPSGDKKEGAIARDGAQVISPGVSAGGKEWSTKAFIHTSQQKATCVRDGKSLVLEGSLTDANRVHPEQAAVEIYRLGGDQPRLEVEMHSAYCSLQPDESLSFTLTFRLEELTANK